MSETVPTGNILQFPDQQTADFQKGVANSSTGAGHPITASETDPEHKTPLLDLQRGLGDTFKDVAHIVGTSGTFIGGEEPGTYDRVVDEKEGLGIKNIRDRLKAGVDRVLNKQKAA